MVTAKGVIGGAVATNSYDIVIVTVKQTPTATNLNSYCIQFEGDLKDDDVIALNDIRATDSE